MKSLFRLFFLLCILTVSLTGCKSGQPANGGEGSATDSVQLTNVRFNADSAFASIKTQCGFGARVPGSTAHEQCGDYIVRTFSQYGLKVTEQKTPLTTWDGKTYPCRNIIASYRPEVADRVVIAAHWDSRPWADEDPDESKRRQPVMAANDGASGVAVMIEIARQIKSLNPAVGVDFICFDLEDYGAPQWGTSDPEGKDWCLGSAYWAKQAAASGYKARYGILLDMVGGRDARFCYEGFSKNYAEPIVNRIWETAEAVGAGHLFVKADGTYITDDHIPMNETAHIPTVDIIPFTTHATATMGETWHTTQDTPENISPENLRLVGQTLLQMLSEEM